MGWSVPERFARNIERVAARSAGRASGRQTQPGSDKAVRSTESPPATGPRIHAHRRKGAARGDQGRGVTALRPAGVSNQRWRMR